MSTTDTRAAFEYWFSDEGAHPKAIERSSSGGYILAAASSAWNVWQAATEAARATGTTEELPPLPEGTWFACDHETGVQFHPSEDQAKRYSIDGTCSPYFSSDQMRGYGRQCMKIEKRPESAIAESDEPEAHKLARILWNMVEAVEDYKPNEIYRDGYQSADGDVFVHRAATVLVEQAAEIAELTRYVDSFGSQLAELKSEAARQPAPVAKPFGWVQFIDGEQTQNFARDEKELATVKAITSTMPGLKNVEYIPVFAAIAATAAPVEQPHYRMSEKPTAWLFTLPEGKFFNDDEQQNSELFLSEEDAVDECNFHGGTLTPLFTAEWTQAGLDYMNEKADELHKKIVGSQP